MAGRSAAGAKRTRRRWQFRSPTLRVALFVMVGFWLAAAITIAIDPYDLYPWGVRVKLRSNFDPDHAEYLGWMAARDKQADVIIVGASTAQLYTPDVIRATFPEARSVWNLSYRGVRPTDRDQLLRFLAEHANARRMIVMLDYFYSANPEIRSPEFPSFLYDTNPFNDLRVINSQLPGVMRSTFKSGAPFATGKPVEQRLIKNLAEQYATNSQPAVRDHWRTVIERRRRDVDRPAERTSCSELVPLDKQLIPVVRELAARGVQVDIYLPPYSPLMYFMFVDDANHVPIAGSSFLEDQLLLRRCVVTETANIPLTAVWAPDRDLGLISNIDNFRDPAHLAWTGSAQATLKAIGNPSYRLTIDNIDAYVRNMRQFIVNYRLPAPEPKANRSS